MPRTAALARNQKFVKDFAKTVQETITTKDGPKKAWVAAQKLNPAYKFLVGQYEIREVLRELQNTDREDWTDEQGGRLFTKSKDTVAGARVLN